MLLSMESTIFTGIFVDGFASELPGAQLYNPGLITHSCRLKEYFMEKVKLIWLNGKDLNLQEKMVLVDKTVVVQHT